MASPELFVLSAFCGQPLVTLAHELGHAGAAMCFSKERVEICVGRPDRAVSFDVGRLRVSVSPFGYGGICRSSSRGMSREQMLVRVLAGPAVNVALALGAWLAGNAATGSLRAVLFTLAAISALKIHNLIPRWSAQSSLSGGLPSDGLIALCLLRRRPPPPRPAKTIKRGLNDPIGRDQILPIAIGIAVGMLLAARVITTDLVYIWVGLAVQQMLNTRVPAREPVTQGVASAMSNEPMKVCPNCGAQVRRATRLCYCYYAFELAQADARSRLPAPALERDFGAQHWLM